MRPIWVTRDAKPQPTSLANLEYYPLLLCTASRRVSNMESGTALYNPVDWLEPGTEYNYIQGAGDDSEAWAHVSHFTHFITLTASIDPYLFNHELVISSQRGHLYTDQHITLLACGRQREPPIYI